MTRAISPQPQNNSEYIRGAQGELDVYDPVDRYRELYELLARLVQQEKLEGALTEVLSASMSVVGADAGCIRLFTAQDGDPLQSAYPFVVYQGLSDRYVQYISALTKPVVSNSRRAVYEGRRVLVEDMTSDPSFWPHLDVVIAEGIISMQATPMMSANASRSLGAITTYFRNRYTPPEETFETLDLYAELAASTIERHQQIAELELRESTLREMIGDKKGQLKRLQTDLEGLAQRAFSLDHLEIWRRTTLMALEIERSLNRKDQQQDKPKQLDQVECSADSYGMSARELEVLIQVRNGLSDKEIAKAMGISPFTVSKHVGSILQKMNVSGRTQAAIRAERDGLFLTKDDAAS